MHRSSLLLLLLQLWLRCLCSIFSQMLNLGILPTPFPDDSTFLQKHRKHVVSPPLKLSHLHFQRTTSHGWVNTMRNVIVISLYSYLLDYFFFKCMFFRIKKRTKHHEDKSLKHQVSSLSGPNIPIHLAGQSCRVCVCVCVCLYTCIRVSICV